MKNKKIVLAIIVVLIVGFVLAIQSYQKNIDQLNENLVATVGSSVFVKEHSPSFGENKSDVIITEFIDPECESCAAFYPAIKEIFGDYNVETKLVIRYLAFHDNSKFAVKLLESARLQNKFKEALEVIFKTQNQWAQHNNPQPELLWILLPEAGLDMAKLKEDFEKIDVDTILELDSQDATTLGVRGTPTFFVNGKKLHELSYKALRDLVESEIYK